ncbi:MAG: hypothetical protein ACLPVF_06805 [Acidimicrobiales bacterium]
MTVTALSAVVPRVRTTVAGRIIAVRAYSRPWTRCDVELSDGTGSVVLRFMGRAELPGLVAGATLVAEGTPGLEEGALIIRNPLYRLTADGAHPG